MGRANAASTLDEEGASILYKGANMSQLSILFKVDDRILKEKMYGIQPVGKRGNAAIYDVAEVAARMGKLTEEQVDAAMMRLNHNDLPKSLTKEYWAGLRSRQEYMLKEGELWPTQKVVKTIGELFKLVSMSAKLMVDTVERQVELTDRQRDLIKQHADGMVRDYRRLVLEAQKEAKMEEDDGDL
jgi:hypothetical protein